MGPVRQNPMLRTVSLFICVCIALCTIVAHNIAQNRPDSFPPCPQTTRVPCSNAAKTWNPLKFAAVPQTPEPISAITGPKFTILWGLVEEVLLFNKFFLIVDTCLSCEDTARQSCAIMLSWQFFGDFCILYFQWAACSTFQTCILNSR